jgi:arabinose-5-phosphate isomerase
MRQVLRAESEALAQVAQRVDRQWSRAIELIFPQNRKVVVSGVGKSGHVARKVAATLSSTGTAAVFLHPSDAAHGDLGMCVAGDPAILISRSGTTAELLQLVPQLRGLGSPLIAILGNATSPLGRLADVVLDAAVSREADAWNLAPTCSSTVALAIGDALAIALMQARGFTDQDFARFHPAGQLGRNLALCVGDVMHRGEEVAWVSPAAPLREVMIAMTHFPLGAACVVNDRQSLLGLVTDGDVRRALLLDTDIRTAQAKDIMTLRPVTVSARASLQEATRLMEDRPSQLSVLPVLGDNQCCLGLLRIHDIYQSCIS